MLYALCFFSLSYVYALSICALDDERILQKFFICFLKRRRQEIQSPSGVFFRAMAFAIFFGQFFLMRCFFCSPNCNSKSRNTSVMQNRPSIVHHSIHSFSRDYGFPCFFQNTFFPKAQPPVDDVGSGLTEWCEKERRALQVQSLIKMRVLSQMSEFNHALGMGTSLYHRCWDGPHIRFWG